MSSSQWSPLLPHQASHLPRDAGALCQCGLLLPRALGFVRRDSPEVWRPLALPLCFPRRIRSSDRRAWSLCLPFPLGASRPEGMFFPLWPSVPEVPVGRQPERDLGCPAWPVRPSPSILILGLDISTPWPTDQEPGLVNMVHTKI